MSKGKDQSHKFLQISRILNHSPPVRKVKAFDFVLMIDKDQGAENVRDHRSVCMIRKGPVAKIAKDHRFALMDVLNGGAKNAREHKFALTIA